MEYSVSDTATAREITMTGAFGFADNGKVRKIIEELGAASAADCVIDLADVSTIDSAGLGMIILINDAVSGSDKSLTLRNPQGQVRKMLEISKFDELMSIEE